eukprot:gene3257-3471_t
MPLESTMICLDNSDWMRNGDYAPSRLDAQQDAAGMLINDRLNSNPENTVGVISMAGHGVDTLASPTEEAGKVLACFARIKMGGKSDLVTAIQIAQLALKHRKNKNGGQRIIAFVGSPLTDASQNLVKVGKQLKKNNVALDIISIGENDENLPKLEELINAANANENSHLINVPAGVSPVNALISSPIMYGSAIMGGGGAASANAGDNFDMYGGIDPALDPELAMAIRVSTEEARAQEEARLKAVQEQSGNVNVPTAIPEEDDEEAMMRRAIEMSMQEAFNSTNANSSSSNNNASSSAMEVANATGDEEFDEDEELQRALALSMQASTNPPTAQSTTNTTSDADLVGQLLNNADPNDPLVQAALAQLQQSKHQDGGEGTDKNRKRKKEDE